MSRTHWTPTWNPMPHLALVIACGRWGYKPSNHDPFPLIWCLQNNICFTIKTRREQRPLSYVPTQRCWPKLSSIHASCCTHLVVFVTGWLYLSTTNPWLAGYTIAYIVDFKTRKLYWDSLSRSIPLHKMLQHNEPSKTWVTLGSRWKAEKWEGSTSEVSDCLLISLLSTKRITPRIIGCKIFSYLMWMLAF